MRFSDGTFPNRMSLNQLRRVTNVPICVILIKPNKGALSSRKYSIFIYVLMEICCQWSKLLDPLCKIKNWDHSWTNWENPFQKGQTQKFLNQRPPIFWGAWMGNKIYISTYVQKVLHKNELSLSKLQCTVQYS